MHLTCKKQALERKMIYGFFLVDPELSGITQWKGAGCNKEWVFCLFVLTRKKADEENERR